MGQIKKFGAFAGVFTPSILTILGVIMYLRLGWVVGEAGLIIALGIIIIAHIISVSTGLSISSIATDKKIRGGGIYYILSRSLGLPMGGAIGIALAVGLAISISLYLIGFAESFLSIEWIRNFLGLGQDIYSYRIVGTAAIILLVIIAFISTSLAIKAQYYILAAIGLSLVSIIIGFITNTEFAPDSILITASRDRVPLEVIFAVFFPAVTGFTVGVAMSGDLKNPKRSIPSGTMTAIALGFVVYVGLAIGLAYFVNRELLINDPNFLMKIAWFSPFVIAGIWGATLSSALGGILGGPRILQALSGDKITPKIFARGFGANNEPRNALILVFIIAEAGILIGELNVIARIVSMFFLVSYGFINLSYYLESWASSDFRPYFKINKYIGLLGFIACFAVMYELDKGSMFASLVIMLGIYSFLKRKQIKDDYGDVWQSVWLSIIRHALHKIDKDKIEERNWRPNIILFSGGTNKRPYLLDFGKALVGKHGILSNFDLIEKKEAKSLFSIQKKSIPPKLAKKGVFVRQQYVNNIYDGIETIARTYGFSGIEPNTVILGWGRQTSDPKRFVQLINSLNELDLNILLLDFDKNLKFGDYKKVDIWWESDGSQGNLSLTLSKFISSSEEWHDAIFRLMIINHLNEESESIQKNAQKVLDSLRVDAEIKIINNQIEQKPFYDILLSESKNSDLIFIGLPESDDDNSIEFIEKTNKLLHNIGSVVLVKASSNFKDLNLGLPPEKQNQIHNKIKLIIPETEEIPEITYSKQKNAARQISDLYSSQTELINNFYSKYLLRVFKQHIDIIKSIENITYLNFDKIEKDFLLSKKVKKPGVLNITIADFLIKSIRIINEKKTGLIKDQKNTFDEALDYFFNNLKEELGKIPEIIDVKIKEEELKSIKSDDVYVRLFKARKKALNSRKKLRKGIPYKIKFKKLIIGSFLPGIHQIIYEMEEQYGVFSLQYIIELQKLINSINTSFLYVSQKLSNNNISIDIINLEKQKIRNSINELVNFIQKSQQSSYAQVILKTTAVIQAISDDSAKTPPNHYIKLYKKKNLLELKGKITAVPIKLYNNQTLLFSKAEFEVRILLLKNRLKNVFSEASTEISKTIKDNIIDPLNVVKKNIKKKTPLENLQYPGDEESFSLILDKITEISAKNIRANINKLPANMVFISDNSLNEFPKKQFNDILTIKVSILRLIDFLIQENVFDPMKNIINSLSSQLDHMVTDTNDIIRLIMIFNKKEDGTGLDDLNITDDYDAFIETHLEKIDSQLISAQNLLSETQTKIEGALSSTYDKLSLFNLLKYSGNIKQYIQKKEVKKKIASVQKAYDKIRVFYRNQTEKFWYKQSDAILFAKKIQAEKTNNILSINNFLELKEKVSADPEILSTLPFYYIQLFIQKHYYQDEFWFGRQGLLNKAEKAINWYNKEHSGSILITGDQNSGKTFLAQHIVLKYLQNHQMYIVNPPSGGSIEANIFKKTLQNTTGINGSYKNIFSKLPDNSVILIDDLELWWEKSENGSKVILEIINLIKDYSSKCLFLINAGKQSFEVINEMIRIDKYLLSIIECTPFNAVCLKEIILFRHQSGGIKLQLERRKKFISSKFASLFSKHFNYSNGNIGVALYTWIANISAYHDETIYIKAPQIPDTSVFNSLDNESLIYLTQFILHKQLTFPKLERITLDEKEIITEKILFLKRIGLINELPNKVFELNKYLYIHVFNKLLEKEML